MLTIYFEYIMDIIFDDWDLGYADDTTLLGENEEAIKCIYGLKTTSPSFGVAINSEDTKIIIFESESI